MFGLVVVGLIAGVLVRLLVSGRHDISVAMTIVVGGIGSFAGGLFGYLIFHKDGQDGLVQPSAIVGSIVGAVVSSVIAAVIVLLVRSRVGALRVRR